MISQIAAQIAAQCRPQIPGVAAPVVPSGPYVVSVSSDFRADGSTGWTYSLDAHQTDDIILMYIHQDDNASPSGWSASTDWTYWFSSVGSDMGANNRATQWIRCTSGAMTNPTINPITPTASKQVVVTCVVIRGCVTIGIPFEAEARRNAYSANCLILAATPTVTGGLLVCHTMQGYQPWTGSYTTPPPPAGWTLDGQATGSQGLWKDFFMSYDTLTTSGVDTPAETMMVLSAANAQYSNWMIMKPAV